MLACLRKSDAMRYCRWIFKKTEELNRKFEYLVGKSHFAECKTTEMNTLTKCGLRSNECPRNACRVGSISSCRSTLACVQIDHTISLLHQGTCKPSPSQASQQQLKEVNRVSTIGSTRRKFGLQIVEFGWFVFFCIEGEETRKAWRDSFARLHWI